MNNGEDASRYKAGDDAIADELIGLVDSVLPWKDSYVWSRAYTSAEKKAQRGVHEILSEVLRNRECTKSGKTLTITKKQIKALTKEHLYLIILDQDDEIQQLKKDIDKIARAFQSGYKQGRCDIYGQKQI